MPPQSRGEGLMKPPPSPTGYSSKSTPNLPTLRTLKTTTTTSTTSTTKPPHRPPSPSTTLSPTSPTSLEDYALSSPSSSESEPPSSLPPKFYHHHSHSHSHLPPPTFHPPFYNRPPTPLPPSPSLTSLLRPTFTTATPSRPASPSPSSDENTPPPSSASATATLTTSFRTAKPIPRASPQVPTYEYYGFTLYLSASLAFIIYLLWSFLPSPFLHQLGLYYYPDRWWALAIPAWTVMAVVYIYVALASYNTGYLTLGLGDVETLVDEAANVAVVDGEGRVVRDERASWLVESGGGGKDGRARVGGQGSGRRASVTRGVELEWRGLWNEGTDAVMDIPVGGVCEILYGRAE